jgi:hypothetical protein
MQFFPADWLQDTQILSLESQGAWMKLICAMWVAPERGVLNWTTTQFEVFLCCATDRELATEIWNELQNSNVGELVTDGNGNVTIKCRRMIREELQRFQTRERVKRHRNGDSNGAVTQMKRRIYHISEVRSHISEEDKNKISSAALTQKPWDPEDQWLKDLIETQTVFLNVNGQLMDYAWWEDVSTAINGIEPEFLTREFSKMSAWYREHPERRPTAKGVRRFVRTWLEKAKEQDRRVYVGKKI